jgi:hypothetical protein
MLIPEYLHAPIIGFAVLGLFVTFVRLNGLSLILR